MVGIMRYLAVLFFSFLLSSPCSAFIIARGSGGGEPACDTIQQAYVGTVDSSTEFMDATGRESQATKFQASSAFTPCAAGVYIYKSTEPTDITLTIQLYEDDGGSGDDSRPDYVSGPICSSAGGYDATDLGSVSDTEVVFDLSSCPALVSSNLYWVRVLGSGTPVNNALYWNKWDNGAETYELSIVSSTNGSSDFSVDGARARKVNLYGN